MTNAEKAEELRKRAPLEISKAKKTLSDAELLLESERFESAISRAYYAIFHAARAALYHEGSAPVTHRGVSSEFSKLLIKNGKVEDIYGTILQDARDERQTADYESSERETLPDPELARKVVANARQFIDQMSQVITRED